MFGFFHTLTMPTAGELSKSSIDITEKYDTLTNKYRIVIIGMEIIIAKGIFLLINKVKN